MSVGVITYDRAVVRWEPDAQGRLGEAAMALFAEHGYEATTVADIAARAGLTERTFFRYYSDKREVFFAGANELQDFLVKQVANAPTNLAPLEVVVSAYAASGTEIFESRRRFARQRQAVIATHADLQERELTKMARLATALADALMDKGFNELPARLAAETGTAIFRLAFEAWTSARSKMTLAQTIDNVTSEQSTINSARGSG
jgi:AcrR family transcriptional regulator